MSGLHTYVNLLDAPPGTLTQADNIVIDRDSVAEPRRGFGQYGDTTAVQLLTYKNVLLAHTGTQLQYDNLTGPVSARFDTFSGTYLPVESGRRIRGIEANGNFYFTTSDGIKKISASNPNQFTTATGYITSAGGPQAVDISATVDYSQPLWFTPRSKIAYRVVFGITDANNNLILGAPSEYLEVTNFSYTDSAVTDMSITVPSRVDSVNYIYQVYRSGLYTETVGLPLASVQTSDELFLVFEANVPAASLISKNIALTDITPDSLRAQGAPLYTNQNSGDGQGILGANLPPPIAKDLALFNGNTFYANTQSAQTLEIDLLSVQNAVSDVSKLVISNGSSTNVYTFRGVEQVTNINTQPASSLSLPTGLDGKYFTFVSANNQRSYYAWFASDSSVVEPSATGLVGSIGIRVDTSTDNIRTLSVTGSYSFASGDFTSAYFTLDSANNVNQYYVWYRTSAAQIPTLVADRTGIEVDITGYSSLSNTLIATMNAFLASPAANDMTVSINSPTNTILTFTNNEKGHVAAAIETFTPANFVLADTYVVSLTGTVVPALTGAIAASAGFDFTSSVSGSYTVQLTNTEAGPATFASDGASATTFTISTPVTGVGEDAATNHILLSKSVSLGVALQDTAKSIVRVTDSNTTGIVDSFYISGPTDIAGKMNFQARHLSDPPFYFAVSGSLLSSEYSPEIPYLRNINAITEVSGAVVRVTSSGHLVTANTNVILYGTNSTPAVNGIFTITAASANTFDINISSISATGLSASGSSGFMFPALVSSTDTLYPNRLYFSKFQQPEAVPVLNFEDIGPRDKAIQRIIPLRDSLMVLKDEGIYRVVGTDGSYTISLFDSSSQIRGPDTAAVLNNLIYCNSTQGVVSVSETGVKIVSRAIEDKLRILSTYPYFNTASFGQGYETERAYLLSVPFQRTDTVATQVYRYNFITDAWTRWDLSNLSSVVNPVSNLLYLGAADEAVVDQERKLFDRTDYADRQFDLTVQLNTVIVDTVRLSSILDATVGDALVQTQYLTPSLFNRTLLKMNKDPLLNSTGFSPALNVEPGNDIAQSVVNLAATLDTIPSVSAINFTSYMASGSEFTTAQSNYNTVVDLLNNATGAFYSNYTSSSGTLEVEALITAVNKSTNVVTLNFASDFLFGPIVLYQGYQQTITWAPMGFGDVSMLKQISEGTAMFFNDDFSTAQLSFSSDLSPNFEAIEFNRLGDGSWGNFIFGNQTFGGEGTGVPLRTYIPRNKQRCRYLNVRFSHRNARETFQLYGVSLESRSYSSRAYR